MKVIPVIDIRGGIAVRAVAGVRKDYRPLRSCWTVSSEPAVILQALVHEFGFQSCYVADLDHIESRGQDQASTRSNRCLHAELVRSMPELVLDAGTQSASEAIELLELGVAKVVLSSESLPEIACLPELITAMGPEHVVFSLDLRNGKVLRPANDERYWSPLDLALLAIESGVQQLIVLDLAAVGVGRGIPTLDLCCDIRRARPTIALWSGGGVNDEHDLDEAQAAGLNGVLVSSALHDGRLNPECLRSFFK